MSARKLALVILLFGIGSAAVVALVTRNAPPSPGAVSEPAPPPVAAAVVAAPQGPTQQELVAAGDVLGRPKPVAPAVPPEEARTPPPPPPSAGSWEAVDPVGRPAELGAIGPGLMIGLRNASPMLSRCFDEATEAQYAASGARPVVASDAAGGAAGGPPVLLLELETRAGSVLIVDAPMESRGSASDAAIACAQQTLRGMSVPVAQAKPGARHRLRYALMR